MRRIIGLGVRLAVLWCAWWVLAALGVHIAVPRLVEAEPGTEATLAGVGGFPGHFDIELTDLQLGDTAARWEGPALRLTARAWNPAHFDLVLPPESELRLGAERLSLTSGNNRGEIALLPLPSLPFDRLEIELGDVAVASNRGWAAALQGGVARIRQGEGDNSYDVDVDLAGLTLPPEVKRQIDLAGRQTDTIETVSLDATAMFDARWDRHALEGPRPQPVSVGIRAAEFIWGDLRISVEGRFEVADGIPEGKVNLATPDWRALYDFAVANQMIPPEDQGRVQTALGVLSLGGEGLSVPVTFQNGQMAIGPVPVGPAPELRIP